MTSRIGMTPPIHRRFNEREAIEAICDRYGIFREKISEQVLVLQQSEQFRARCRNYYARGYKDWMLLLAIYNYMLNLQLK